MTLSPTNEVKLSGTIEKLKSIKTRTGTSMATMLLKVGQDRFRVVAFKNVADAVLQCRDGDQISVKGTGSINSWKDNEGHWHNDFQVTAWEVEIAGNSVSYEKTSGQSNARPGPQAPSNEHDYQGGPF